MAEKHPLCLYNGEIKELESGDTLPDISPVTGDMPTGRFRSSAGQSAISTSDIAIQWNVEDWEDSQFTHDTVTNPERIQVNQDGKYLVTGVLNYYGTTSNYRLTTRCSIRINGTTILDEYFDGSYVRATTNSNNTGITFSTILDLAEDDYFEILSKRLSSVEGDGVTTDGTNLSIVQLIGAKGDTGEDGGLIVHSATHTDGTDDIQSATNAQKGLATASQIAAIEANTAKETNVTTDLSIVKTATQNTIESSDGANAVITSADATNAGLMSKADFDKLAGIEDSAKDDQTGSEIESLLDAELGGTGWKSGGTATDLANSNREMIMQMKMESEAGEYIDGFMDDFEDETMVDNTNSDAVYKTDKYDLFTSSTFDQDGFKSAFSTELDAVNNNSAGSTHRYVIPASILQEDGATIRVKVQSGGVLNVANLSIVEQDTGANGTNTPTELLFNGSSGFILPKSDMFAISDPLVFSIDKTKNYLLIADYIVEAYHKKTTITGTGVYYKLSSSYDQQSVTGFTFIADYFGFLVSLEVLETVVEDTVETSDIAISNEDGKYDEVFNIGSTVSYNNKIYTLGGYNGGSLNKVRIYDIGTGNVTYGTVIPSSMYEFSAVQVAGKIYCFSGSLLRIYDITGNSWSLGTALPSSRVGASAVAISDNLIRLFGGESDNNWEYNISGNSWDSSSYTAVPVSDSRREACYDGNDFVYLFGGYTYKTRVYRYSISADSWERLEDLIFDYDTQGSSEITIYDNKTYLLGVIGNSTIIEYDLKTLQSTIVDRFASAYYNFSYAIVNGIVYCCGGHNGSVYMDDLYQVTLPIKESYRTGENYNLCRGGVAVANSYTTNLPEKAFDNETTTYWDSLEATGSQSGVSAIGYMYGEKKIANKFNIKQNASDNAINSVKVQGYTGSSWVDIETKTIVKDSSEQIITFTSSTEYWGHRLLANAETGVGGWFINQLGFYQTLSALPVGVKDKQLRSENITADANDPTVGFVSCVLTCNESFTTSDFIARASIDDFVTSQVVTMTDRGNGYFTGTVDLTAQADKEMVVQIKGAGTKAITCTAYNYSWSY